MGTVAPMSSGLAYLMQTLANSSSPLVTTTQGLTALQAALQNSPPQDTVQLSASALALQQVDELFGVSSAPATNLPTVSSASSTTASTSSTADQMAAVQSEARANQVATLLSSNSSPASAGGLLNIVA